MSTEDATDLMNRAVEGKKTDADGTFFARRKPGMSDKELVLCIYFKNKPTHHLCTQVTCPVLLHPSVGSIRPRLEQVSTSHRTNDIAILCVLLWSGARKQKNGVIVRLLQAAL